MQFNNTDPVLTLSTNNEAADFLVAITWIEILIGSLSNGVVIITIFIAPELRKRSEDRLILNLGFADLIALTTFLPWHAYLLRQNNITLTRYRIYEVLNSLVFYNEGNAILAIAFDRFVAVVFPLRHKNIMIGRTTIILVVGTWGTAVCFGIIEFLTLHFKLLQNVEALTIPYDATLLLSMAILYAVIFFHTLKQSRYILRQRQSVGMGNEKYSNRLIMKITMKTFLLLVLYCVTYLPVIIFQVYSTLVMGRSREAQMMARSWIYSFLYLSSCVNPFLYTLRTKRFRVAFRRWIWSRIFHTHAGDWRSNF